jgi:hypothetical protein
MKVHRKRFTIMRTAAIAGCLAGLAVPSVAGAMPLPADPPSPSPVVLLNHAKPTAIGADTLSSQSKIRAATPTAIGADTLSSQSKTTGGTFAVHEVRTVSHSDDPTLAIVLASAALGVALFGTGYALTRVASMQRRSVRTS